jgi:hypothetical protein
VNRQCLQEFLPNEREEPRGGRGADRPADMTAIVDGEESDAFRLERPTLAIGPGCGRERHRNPNAVGSELVGDRLAQRLGPSMHLHFNRRDRRSSRAHEIGSTTEYRNLHSNIESLVAEPHRNRFEQI